MDHIGIDVHKQSSQVCILTESGELLERRIKTRRDALAQLFGERLRARIVIETSTESEWVALSQGARPRGSGGGPQFRGDVRHADH